MKKIQGIKLQNLILLMVLPVLFILTGLYAFQNYYTLYATIIDGFDRKLLAISTTSSSFIDGDEHIKIKNEEDELYKKYVNPMKQILQDTELTYHYTLIPQKDNKITYILDATDGEDHSDAGTIEENPEKEAIRLDLIMQSAQASLSDIQEFDIWGQLKIGSAPILNSKGEVSGLVGADVNISTINAKTSQVMLMVFGIGVAAFILATWISFMIAGKLINPIDNIKQAALQVAAGKFGTQVEIKQPLELKELAIAFNKISKSLEDSDKKEAMHTLEQTDFRKIQSLKEQFASVIDNDVSEITILLTSDDSKSVSGLVRNKDLTIAWYGKGFENKLKNLKINSDLKVIINRILESYADIEEEIYENLKAICGADVEYFIFCNQSEQNLKLITKESLFPSLNYKSSAKIELEPGINIDKLSRILKAEDDVTN